MTYLVSKATINCSVFYDITTPHEGGALFDSSAQTTEVSRCLFESVRTTQHNGGVVWKGSGQTRIDKCCFERCSSGIRENNAGGNIAWYKSSGLFVNRSLVYRCCDENNPGDSSIISRESLALEISHSNFSCNNGNYLGNCVSEVVMSNAGFMKFSIAYKGLAYRVIEFMENKNNLVEFSDIINCTVTYFTDLPLTVRSCNIFKNICKYLGSQNIISDCMSDDILFCQKTTSFQTFEFEYGDRAACFRQKNKEKIKHDNNTKIKILITLLCAVFY